MQAEGNYWVMNGQQRLLLEQSLGCLAITILSDYPNSASR